MPLRPEFVPLPYVTEYSDTVNVGDMGLPVGFDAERLVMHVSAVEKMAKLGDIGELSIVGHRGDTTQVSYNASGLLPGGTATASHAASTTKARLHDLHLEADGGLPEHYRWGRATVRINNAEVEARIGNDGNKWELGPLDAKGLAKYTNRALQSGLAEATMESVLSEDPVGTLLKSALEKSTVVIFCGLLFGVDIQRALFIAAISDVFYAPLDHFIVKRRKGAELPTRQWSMFPHIHYDRLLASQGLTRATQLIRARE